MKREVKTGDAKPVFAIYTPKYFPHYVGGGERIVQMMAAGLRNIGISAVILSDGELEEYEFDGIRIISLPHHIEDAFLGHATPCVHELRRVLRELGVQAVHTTNVNGLFQIATVAEDLKLSFGMTAYHHGLVCDRQTLLRGDNSVCEGCRPAAECFACSIQGLRIRDKLFAEIGRHLPESPTLLITETMNRLFGRPLGRQLTWWRDKLAADNRLARGLQRLDVFMTPTRWNLELTRPRLPAEIASEVILWPLPQELLCPEPKVIPRELLRVGFVGRSIRIKGLHVLIAAVEQIGSEIPVELHIFCPRNGGEEAEYWLPLKDRVDQLDGATWTECGLLDGAALRKIHGRIDVLALPSVWHDFCPVVTLEAQALGTPVILSDFPSQREVFGEDQRSAWFVAPGEVSAWARCLISVWKAKQSGELRAPTCCVPNIEGYAQRLLQTYQRSQRPLQF